MASLHSPVRDEPTKDQGLSSLVGVPDIGDFGLKLDPKRSVDSVPVKDDKDDKEKDEEKS